MAYDLPTKRWWIWTVALVMALAVGCTDPVEFDATTLVEDVEAVTVASLPDGTVLWADRTAGTVHRVGQDVPLLTVDVDAARQGGLIGLVADESGRIFVSWVDPQRQLTVAEVVGEDLVSVWAGVPAPDGGLGGRLAFAADGSLWVGLGNGSDLSSFGLAGGAMVKLDPDGPSDQAPEIVSTGWNNPFAFAIDTNGAVWVADNHPSDGDDRLARADLGETAERVTTLPDKFGSSGLVAISPDELWVCSYVTKRLDRYRVSDTGVAQRSGTVANDCRFDATLMADGRVVYSTGEAIKIIDPAGAPGQ